MIHDELETRVEERTRGLAEATARLRMALDHMPGGMMVLDRDRNYVVVNDQYAKLHGFPDGVVKVGGSFVNEMRYQAERGDYFGPHRDNFTPANAHRRFAMTLNLNTGEYQGGGVRFPEYAPDVCDPEAGGAVIFSCSLLHEAVAVTKGRRFILSGFMWGEQEERQRQQYNARTAGQLQRPA